jgi:hypothetical protein
MQYHGHDDTRSDIGTVSEDTLSKIEAAKAYIENLYKNQQERSMERMAR